MGAYGFGLMSNGVIASVESLSPNKKDMPMSRGIGYRSAGLASLIIGGSSLFKSSTLVGELSYHWLVHINSYHSGMGSYCSALTLATSSLYSALYPNLFGNSNP